MKIIWLLFFQILLSPINKNPGNDPPEGLMVEFIRKPDHVLITDSKPEFTWIEPEKAVRQTAYQVLNRAGIAIRSLSRGTKGIQVNRLSFFPIHRESSHPSATVNLRTAILNLIPVLYTRKHTGTILMTLKALLKVQILS
jgi:hypothetical protein